MTHETALIFGCVTRNEGRGKPFHNTAVVAQRGDVVLEQHKTLLPTYDVFDELRYFEPATDRHVIELSGKKLGVLICEDFWFGDEILGRPRYSGNPVTDVVEQGAEILINISAPRSMSGSGQRGTTYSARSPRPIRCRSSTATRSGATTSCSSMDRRS